jgi:hypothetical protein
LTLDGLGEAVEVLRGARPNRASDALVETPTTPR